MSSKFVAKGSLGRDKLLIVVSSKVEIFNYERDMPARDREYGRLVSVENSLETHQVVGNLAYYKCQDLEIQLVSQFPYVTVGEWLDENCDLRKFWWCLGKHSTEIKQVLPRESRLSANDLNPFWETTIKRKKQIFGIVPQGLRY